MNNKSNFAFQMKTYFRLLSFAKPIEKFAIPYISYTVLYVIYSTLVLALLAPLLNTLFSTDPSATKTVVHIIKQPSIWNLNELFKYYLQYYIIDYGPWGALKFVCSVIIAAVFLGNLFRYLSQRTMENLRAHTFLNLRNLVFNNIMNLHIGYFNNERKGDIISKVTSDVQYVRFSVTATLRVIFKEPLQLIAFLITLFIISPSLTLYNE